MVDQTSQFYAILTNVGAAKQANADALGIPWKITQMAVGDGNPNGLESPPLPTPDASWTQLLNEWRRAPLNQLKVDDKDHSIIVAEQVIPAEIGGRWIREIALYDADGDMVAVANCAPTYKPLLNQGSGRTQVVRMNLVVSSSSNVQLKIDPSVVLATREWVTEELAKQDFKHSVLVATTAAITLSGLQTIDGVALTASARVLVKNQTAAKDNGLYLVVASGTWTRCSDADTSAKVTPGMLVLVEKGTINADSAWQLVSDGPITLGVSALAFEMVFGRTGVAAGTFRSVTVDAYGRVVEATNPTTVAGYGLTDVYTKTQMDQALALKAPLAGPLFTGDPKAPTPVATDNDTSIATTAFVRAAMALFGLGATASQFGGNIDTLALTGFYLISGNAGNMPVWPAGYPGGVEGQAITGGNLIHIERGSGGAATQIFDALVNTDVPVTLIRSKKLNGIWLPWREIATIDSPSFVGSPTAPTAFFGDRSKKLANTEFVQSALGNLSGAPITFSEDTELTPTHAGLLILVGSSAQLTLPLLASVPDGTCYHILFNREGSSVRGNGTQYIQGAGSPVLIYNAAYGERLTVVRRSNAWYVASGGVGSDGLLALRGASGWEKKSGGLIEQWGFVTTPSGVSTANIDITFPIKFPTGCFGVVASIGVYTNNYDYNAIYRSCRQDVSLAVATLTGVGAQAFIDNNLSSVRVIQWRANGY